jgi:ligand-binding sensor domain-containing protein
VKVINPIAKLNRRTFWLVAGFVLLAAIGAYWFFHDILSTVSRERELLKSAQKVIVETVGLQAPDQAGIEYYGYTQDARALEKFAGSYYAATAGGLMVFDDQGRVTAHYTTRDGLPENDLTAIETFQGKLYIGTAGQGLISYDGRAFIQHRFLQPKAQHVSALAATESALLIGTFDDGLFQYDGDQFGRFGSSAGATELKQITVIFSQFPTIWVGTFAQGLFVWREGRWDHFTTKEGLPSDRVTAMLGDLDGVLISTDLGIVRLREGGGITPVVEMANVTSLARFQEKIYAGLFTEQIVELETPKERRPSKAQRNQLALPHSATNINLTTETDRLWAITSRGFYFTTSPGIEAFKRFDQPRGTLQLAASHISALAIDGRGRLWVGYFDHGIDVIDPDHPRLITHIEDEVIREINFLRLDAERRRMLVATSAGLVVIDELMHHQRYTESDGLISNSVSHVMEVPANIILPRPDERLRQAEALVVTTGRGLSVYAEGVFRSLNAFHGLASNHLYTSARVGDRLFVGSLNGLNELEGLRVVRTFQTSNSRLSHNWVSALAAVGSTLYIGTYGGGVDALLPSGEMINFASLIGKFSVNPNAMHFDGERLYVGTLEQGVWILNVQTDTWSHFTQGLGSSNVTAITSNARAIYFGTDRGLTRVERARLR